MNAAVDTSLLLPTAAEALAAGGSRDRRGPFRPEKLVSARERRSGGMSVRLFRSVDVIALVVFSGLFALSSEPGGLLQAPLANVLPFVVVAVLGYALLGTAGLYRFVRSEPLVGHSLKAAAAITASLLAGIAVAALLGVPDRVDTALWQWGSVAGAFFLTLHALWWSLVHRWRRQGKLTPNIVVVGATRHARKLIEAAVEARNVNILGVFDDRLSRVPESVAGVPVLGNIQSLLGHKITPYVDQIVIALDTSAKARVKDLIEKLRSLPNEVSLMVDVETDTDRKAALSRMADMPLARVSGVGEDERKAIAKRLQDLIIGTIALIVFGPLMIVAAIAIKLDSRGPVFFKQNRHGFNNETIRVWKFRSMYTHMADATAARQVQRNDDRVTRVGGFIRRTSIDELPQIFNVLRGEMSLVGPRPHAIGMKTGAEESARLVAEYAWRHRMKPGITGWAAIKGSRGALDTPEAVRRRVALDIEYIERQSFWFDLYIMLMTVPSLFGDSEAIR